MERRKCGKDVVEGDKDLSGRRSVVVPNVIVAEVGANRWRSGLDSTWRAQGQLSSRKRSRKTKPTPLSVLCQSAAGGKGNMASMRLVRDRSDDEANVAECFQLLVELANVRCSKAIFILYPIIS